MFYRQFRISRSFYLILLVGLILISSLLFLINLTDLIPAKAASNSINVTGKISYKITLTVYPERRIPQVGNWVNTASVSIRPEGSTRELLKLDLEFDSEGKSSFTLDSGTIPIGKYDIVVEGDSHLRKVFTSINFNDSSEDINLTLNDEVLFAGDISPIKDNYVNSLDFSVFDLNIYSDDLRSDLNRDGIVNSLDVSNLAINLYEEGER